MSAESAVSRWAEQSPEAPAVFFRGRRGHFRWLSREDVARGAWTAPGEDAPPGDLVELLEFAREIPPVAKPSERAPRDVWISWRSPSDAPERQVAAWAIASGAAIVVERSAEFPVLLAHWVRPTVVAAPAAAVGRWLERTAAEAPRFLRTRWLRHRLGRVRWVVAEEASREERARIAATLRALVPAIETRVEPAPPARAEAPDPLV